MNMSGSGHTLSDVALDITVECMDERGIRHEIDTVLGYRSSDPFAVAMTFITSDGNLVWTFGRDLLIRGTESPSGDGDVHVSPTIGVSGRAMISIELSSPTVTSCCWPGPATSMTSSPAPRPSSRPAPSRTSSTPTCSSARSSPPEALPGPRLSAVGVLGDPAAVEP